MALAHSPRIVTDGLVLCLDAANPKSYPGSGTVWTDLSGNNTNGTLVNGVTFDTNNFGSMSFDGVNDYVSISNPEYTLGGSNSYTFDFFIKLPHSANNQTIFSNGNLSTNGIWFFKRRSGLDNKLTFHGYSLNPRIDVLSNDIIPDNENCSVSLSFNGVNLYKIYINGNLQNSTTTNPVTAGTGNSFIGSTSGTGNFLSGNVSIGKIYNRTLSDSEIQQNFNALRGRFGL